MSRYILISGVKGGVGKSAVSTGLAAKLAHRGIKTLLIDCDLEGPNCARIFGVQDKRMGLGPHIMPVVISPMLGLLSVENHPIVLANKMAPVLLGESHRQFIAECLRAMQQLDYEVVVFDFPAEHGDALHTLKQKLGTLHGMIIVTIPSKIATDNCRYAIKAARDLDIPIIGLIENMSKFTCECGREHRIFGEASNVQELVKEFDLTYLGEQPFDPELARNADRGIAVNNPILERVVDRLEKLWGLGKLGGRG